MNVIDIPLENICFQKHFKNRGSASSITSSTSFLNLLNSIKNRKTLIHPITVYKEGDGYEGLAGEKRFLAYTQLNKMFPDKGFDKIPSSVLEEKTYDEYAKFHEDENLHREALSNNELFESRLSYIPFALNCGIKGEAQKNMVIGMEIVYDFYRFTTTRKDTVRQELFDKLKNMSGLEEPMDILNELFMGYGETIRSFYEKSTIFSFDEHIVTLYKKGRIGIKVAYALDKLFIIFKKDCLVILDNFSKDPNYYIGYDEIKDIVKTHEKSDTLIFSKIKGVIKRANSKRDKLGAEQIKTINAALVTIEKAIKGKI